MLCELLQLQELFLFTWLYHFVYVWGRKNKNAIDKVKKFYHTKEACVPNHNSGFRSSMQPFSSGISFLLPRRHAYPAVHVRRNLSPYLIAECDCRMLTIICHQITDLSLSVSKAQGTVYFHEVRKWFAITANTWNYKKNLDWVKQIFWQSV